MESLLFNLSSGYAIGDTVEVIPQHVKHFVSNPLPIPSSKRKRFDTVSYDNTTSMAKCIDTRLLVLYVTMFETNRELESISSAPQSFSSTYSKVIQHFQAMFRLPDYTLLKTREKIQELYIIGLNMRKVFEETVPTDIYIISILYDFPRYQLRGDKPLKVDVMQRRHRSLPMILDPTSLLRSPCLATIIRRCFSTKEKEEIQEEDIESGRHARSRTLAKLRTMQNNFDRNREECLQKMVQQLKIKVYM